MIALLRTYQPLVLAAALVALTGCIRWTESSTPEVTDFAPGIEDKHDEDHDHSHSDVEVIEPFKVKFETTKGDVVVQIHPEWSPIGAAHFKELVEDGHYNDARFFRVIPGFMAQFGLAGDPAVQAKHDENIKDDPVKETNTRGKLTYAKTGMPNSRSTQLFINYGDNSRLDSDGFSPFGEVISGMEAVDAIESKYGENPDQGAITAQGNKYLKKEFPDLDYIKTATIIVEEPKESSEVAPVEAASKEMPAESKPAEEASKPAEETKPSEDKKPEEETKPAAEMKPAEEAKPAEPVTTEPEKKEDPAPKAENKPAEPTPTPEADKPAETPPPPAEPVSD